MPETNLANLCLVALCGKHAGCCSWNKLLPTAKSQKFHLHTFSCRARDLVLVECHSALLQTAFKPELQLAAQPQPPRHLQHCNDLLTFLKSLHHKTLAWSHKAGLSPTLSGCCRCTKTMDNFTPIWECWITPSTKNYFCKMCPHYSPCFRWSRGCSSCRGTWPRPPWLMWLCTGTRDCTADTCSTWHLCEWEVWPRGWARGNSVIGAPILMYFSDILRLRYEVSLGHGLGSNL